MQTGSEQLRAQQEVMQAKGYYRGKIDGVWGPKSIAAKQKWERSGKFAPAIPNNGFPLDERKSLPPGVQRQVSGLLTCDELKQAANKQPSAPAVVQVAQSSVTVAVEPAAEPQQNKGNGNPNQNHNQQGKK